MKGRGTATFHVNIIIAIATMAGGKSSDCPAGANMHHVGAHSQLMIERLAIVAWHSLAILRLKTQTIPWPDTLHVTVVACEACNFISRITWSHWLEGRHCVPSHSPKDKNMSYAEIAEISGQWQRGMKLPRHPSLEKHQKTHTDSNILQEFRKILGKSLEKSGRFDLVWAPIAGLPEAQVHLVVEMQRTLHVVGKPKTYQGFDIFESEISGPL